MELSKRLQAIADMVTPGNRVADVGCDHGFVSIYLYEKGIAPRVYAMDVRTGPLASAKEHIEEHGLSLYIETRLSDGVKALNTGEADALICAGMGGRLMARILTEGMEKVREMRELILQPQSDLAFFRSFLRENHFAIVQENMIKEDGKFYPMMKVAPVKDCKAQDGDREWQELEDCYGPLLLQEKHPVLKEYLEKQREKNEEIISKLPGGSNEARKQELLQEQAGIDACLRLMNGEGYEVYGDHQATGDPGTC